MIWVVTCGSIANFEGCRKPKGADGDPGTVTTLGHVLNMYGNSPNKTIADVLDIQGGLLCYEYVEL